MNRNKFLIAEFLLGCVTLYISNWLESRCLRQFLAAKHSDPPWVIYCPGAIAVNVVGVTLAVLLALTSAKESKILSLGMGLFSYSISAIVYLCFFKPAGSSF